MPESTLPQPDTNNQKNHNLQNWSSPIPEDRWRGFRHVQRGVEAFKSLDSFEMAELSELDNCLTDHEKQTLGRLLARGKKDEIELFIRTHGANPISDPEGIINVPIGVAKADVVDLSKEASSEANASLLNGDVVHVLFQAGEASRFKRGPMFNLNILEVARELQDELNLKEELGQIEEKKKTFPPLIGQFLAEGPLGPKQFMLLRAGIRRIVQNEISAGRLSEKEAAKKYKEALQNQKVLSFIGQRGSVSASYDEALRKKFNFYGFNSQNIVTVEQELVHGLTATEDGKIILLKEENKSDAAGHLYAFLQATRTGGFTTYTESGRPIKPMEMDALAYLGGRGGKILSIIRINDMDRHSTEIINGKAYSYALSMFNNGYSNVIEGVANPSGQKGGTGTTFGDPETHVLTETHENSYPVLSRAFEKAINKYLEKNKGRHPAYNAMRQWADLSQTRLVLKEFGARIVFVPRQKEIDGQMVSYLGVDMPMGDLSLFLGHYRSRMFQFADSQGKELLIHDMKKKENLGIALRTILRQLEDPHIIAATKEIFNEKNQSFSKSENAPELYGAPTPEFN